MNTTHQPHPASPACVPSSIEPLKVRIAPANFFVSGAALTFDNASLTSSAV